MRIASSRLLVAAVGLALLGASLTAQSVALTYKTIPDGQEPWYPGGYAYGNLSVARPAGAWKLPELKSTYPLYAVARFGDDDRLFVLDRSANSDPFCNVLYFDANANRDLTDDAPLAGEFKKQSASYGSTTFKSVDLTITRSGVRMPFRFMPQIYSGQLQRLSDAALKPQDLPGIVGFQLRTRCYYGGSLQLGGTTYSLGLGDADCNGSFDSSFTVPRVSYADGRLPQGGDYFFLAEGTADWRSLLYLGRYLAVGESLYQLAVDILGGRMSLTPVSTGTRVRLPMPTAKLELASRDGTAVMAFACTEAVRVPEGAYKVAQYQVMQKTASGDDWLLEAAGTAVADYVELRGAAPAALAYGPPFVPRVMVYEWDRRSFASGGRKDVPLNLVVFGAGGEFVTRLMRWRGSSKDIPMSSKNGAQPKEPSYIIVKTSGETVASGSFEYG